MAAPDDTALKALINSNLPDANPGQPRRITAAFLRATLFTLIDWVKTGINGNLSTWYKVGTSSTPATNADDVYRTGKVLLNTSTDTAAHLVINQAGGIGGLKIQANNGRDTWLPAWDGTNYIRGNTILADTYTTDRIGIGTPAPVEKLHIEGNTFVNGTLRFPTATANKRVVLWDNGNDNQFYGFGLNASTLRYQVGASSDAHVFFSGTSAATSQELMRIKGDGRVNIGTTANMVGNNNIALEVGKPGYTLISANTAGILPDAPYGTALGWNLSGGAAESNLMWINKTFINAGLAIGNWNGTTYTEQARFTPNGFGIGTTTNNGKLEVAADNPTLPTPGVLARFTNYHGAGSNGARIQFHQTGVAIWEIGGAPGGDAFVINGYGGGTFPERLRIDNNGNMGLGTNVPTSLTHLKATNGHQQLRLETPYTPSATADSNGQTGQLAWDQNYIYVKVAGGWRRTALQSF